MDLYHSFNGTCIGQVHSCASAGLEHSECVYVYACMCVCTYHWLGAPASLWTDEWFLLGSVWLRSQGLVCAHVYVHVFMEYVCLCWSVWYLRSQGLVWNRVYVCMYVFAGVHVNALRDLYVIVHVLACVCVFPYCVFKDKRKHMHCKVQVWAYLCCL